MNPTENRKIVRAVSVATLISCLYHFVPAAAELLLIQKISCTDQWIWVQICASVLFSTVLMFLSRSFLPDAFVAKRKMRVKEWMLLCALAALCQVISALSQISMQLTLGIDFSEILYGLFHASSFSFSQVVMIAILAPIFEEIVFRGILMHPFAQHQILAILFSSVLFACAHQSFFSIPFAFLMGMLLSWVYLNYSIYWSMALHFFNNAVYGILFAHILSLHPAFAVVQWSFLIVLSVLACAALCMRKERIKAYFKENQMKDGSLTSALHSKVFWCYFVLVMVLGMASILSAS